MEQDIGFEPMTFSLATKHSTTELILHKTLVDRGGIEPPTVPCKGTVFPIIPTAQKRGQGRENRTPTSSIQDSSTTTILFPEKLGAPVRNRTASLALQERTSTIKDTRAKTWYLREELNFCLSVISRLLYH